MCPSHTYPLPGLSRNVRLCASLFLLTASVVDVHAAGLLSDIELAVVSAGAASPVPDPAGDRPDVTDDLNVVADPVSAEWGAPYHPEENISPENAIAIHENSIVDAASHAIIKRHNQTSLSANAQSNLATLNVTNSSRSNAVNAINLHVNTGNVPMTQTNLVEQGEFQQAHYGANTPVLIVHSSFVRDVHSSSYNNATTTEIRNAFSSHHVNSLSIASVAVDPFRPEVLFDIGNIGTIIPAWTLQIIPSLSFDGTYTDPLDGEWGLKGSYTGLSLTSPSLAVNGLYPQGDDLFLDIDFNLPALNMGTIVVEGCVSECSDLSIHLGSIGGDSIIDGITLEGMNPLKDLELNVNTGIATAGSGSFTAGDSNVGLSGELTTHIGAYFDFTLDLSDYWFVDDLFGQNKWSHREDLDYELTIPFSIVDFDVDGFTLNFDGSICVALFGNQNCGQSHYEYQEATFTDNSVISHQTSQQATSNVINESNSFAEVHGGVLTGAEAELIVMTDSDLLLVSDSDVNINDNAQTNMQAANVVNSAATVSANSLNMELSRRGAMNPAAVSGALLNQRNYFNQRL